MRRDGFFLVLVAAVVAALAAILVQFGVDAQLSTLLSGNFRDEVIARQRAKSILAGVKVAIEMDHWRDPKLIPFIANQVGGEGSCKGWVQDEEGKLPVNRLVERGEEGIGILWRYWELRGGTAASFHALLDWIDADDQTFYGESEASFYGKMGAIPRNRPLQSIFELPTIPFLGKELERLRKLKERPFSQDLTVWGSGKINLLTAGRDVLMALDENVTPELVDRVLTERALGHLKTWEDLKRFARVPADVYRTFRKWGTLQSSAFRVRVDVVYRKVQVGLRAVLWQRGAGIKILYFKEDVWPPV